ncbi:MAG: hypothetical protein HUU46_21425 [Candidatus Hydrogenedentes bacterium]|nr:hypothetical protein [Candidatus Hydrogenedentota bacterium]
MHSFFRSAVMVSIGAIVAVLVSTLPTRAADESKALQNQVDKLQKQVSKLQAKLKYMRVEDGGLNGLSGPHVIFEACNVHIRSGSGDTEDEGTPLGLGNLVVGYNETPSITSTARGGSHNLVVGPGHNYSSVAGAVFGKDNNVTGAYASVTAGYYSTASGDYSSVSGGRGHIASGSNSSVSGGYYNTASQGDASVSGGADNVASGYQSTIGGGYQRSISGQFDWAAGGYYQDF